MDLTWVVWFLVWVLVAVAAYLILIRVQLDRIENFLLHLHTEIRNIMSTQTELAADLNALTAQVAKIGTETAATLQKVVELEAAIASGGGTTPEVDAALAALKANGHETYLGIFDTPE